MVFEKKKLHRFSAKIGNLLYVQVNSSIWSLLHKYEEQEEILYSKS